MDRPNLPAMSAALWSIAVARIEVCLAAELAGIQSELVAHAKEYRSQQSGLGESLAVRLEEAAERITRDWTNAELSKRNPPLAGAVSRRPPGSGRLGVSDEQSATKRPRGRPRKDSPSGEPNEAALAAVAEQNPNGEPNQ
jgi:hypothetical protein